GIARRQAIVPALERDPALRAQDAVARAVGARRPGSVRVHHGDDARQRTGAELAQEGVDVGGDPIEVEVGVDLAEARRLDVALAVLLAAQPELVDARAAAARLEQEIAVRVGPGVADRHRHELARTRAGFVDHARVADAHEAPPQPGAARALSVEAVQ